MSVVLSTNKQDLLMSSLREFYKEKKYIDKFIDIVENKKISLRVIDWFVTNYSKKHIIIINKKNLYTDYKLQLKGYSKKQFDPFCRRNRIKFYYTSSEYIETTVGQLNFFKWALELDIMDYITKNFESINEDMNSIHKANYGIKNKKDKQERKKRHEISLNATKTLTKQKVNIVLEFN